MIAENNISGKGSTSTKTQRWKQFWRIQVCLRLVTKSLQEKQTGISC